MLLLSRISSFLLICILCLFSLNSCTPSKANNTEAYSSPYLGLDAPAFNLQDYEGQEYSSDQLKGKYVVLHIATTWCPFCNAEAPHLEQLSADYKDKNVEVIIIDVKEDKELVKEKLIDRFNLTFPVLFDNDGTVAASFAPDDVLPDLARDEVMLASNLIIDPQGKIQFFSLLDTNNFDAQLIELKSRLDELL